MLTKPISLLCLLWGLTSGASGFTKSSLALNAHATEPSHNSLLTFALYEAPNKAKRNGNTAIAVRNPFQLSPTVLKKRLSEVDKRDRSGMELSQSYCDKVLGLCVASDEWDHVLEVLDVMKRHGLKQERSSYRACLQACFEAGNGSSAQEILSAMEKAGIEAEPMDVGLTTAAMCRNNISEPGWWRKALNLLKQHSHGNYTNTVTSRSNPIPIQAYNAVLECMAEECQWKEAVRFLRIMENGSVKTAKKEDGIYPTPALSTYRAVIESCALSNQAEQATQVLTSMKRQGILVRALDAYSIFIVERNESDLFSLSQIAKYLYL